MSVDQTSQLIQLILNTCLLLAIAVAWWAMAWIRHGAIARRLSHIQRQELRHQAGRVSRRSLQRQYRLGRSSVGVMHYVLLGLAASLLALSLRTLLGANWLIPLALVLFMLAVGGLTLSVGLTLMEFYQGVQPRSRRIRRLRSLPARQPPSPKLLPSPTADQVVS
ncbi:hypothetical protein C7271_17645 [filamentous cyanobacterium CCP5]|nr:hypothetical protein C7271_17645 [filamentous cyanobacterium CCP5]